jgi:hypothetical protein
MSFKDFFSFLFIEELQELESCKEQIEELKQINESLQCENITSEYNNYIPISQFESKTELRNWLINNNISQREYISTDYDCEQFALDTCRAANADGFELFPIFDVSGYFTSLKRHVLVGAVIDNILYVSEPQDDSGQIISEERLD